MALPRVAVAAWSIALPALVDTLAVEAGAGDCGAGTALAVVAVAAGAFTAGGFDPCGEQAAKLAAMIARGQLRRAVMTFLPGWFRRKILLPAESLRQG